MQVENFRQVVANDQATLCVPFADFRQQLRMGTTLGFLYRPLHMLQGVFARLCV
ncbi:hypothetical protein D3C80_2176410 [compost metagenome]